MKGDNCSFRHDMHKRGKSSPSNPSQNSFMQQSERKPSRTRSPRGKSPSGRMSRWPCKDYLRGTCNNSFCERWHPPECLFSVWPKSVSTAISPSQVLSKLPTKRINVDMKRNRPRTRDILRNQENIVAQACCGNFHSPSQKKSAIHAFVSFTRTLGWKPSHPTPVFVLYNIDGKKQSQAKMPLNKRVWAVPGSFNTKKQHTLAENYHIFV